MDFRFAADRRVTYPVEVELLREDGSGKTDAFVMPIEYKPMPRSKMRRLLKDAAEAAKVAADTGLGIQISDERAEELRTLLHEHVTGWGIKDENGEPLPFSPENLDAVLDRPALGQAIERGLWAVSQEAPAKN